MTIPTPTKPIITEGKNPIMELTKAGRSANIEGIFFIKSKKYENIPAKLVPVKGFSD